MKPRIAASLFSLVVPLGIADSAIAQVGPDIIVGNLYQVASYGSSNEISAFAVGNISCNSGDDWVKYFSFTNQHPVFGQNMYRLKDGRFEQIGQSWLNHSFFALSENYCFSDCQPTNGQHLGVHCSDPYSASVNGIQSNMGPRYQVNAHTGAFPFPPANPPYSGTIDRRLQVKNDDLDPSLNVGALYFVEGQFVTPDDADAGNQNNNASYRRVTISLGTGGLSCPAGRYCLALGGTTQRGQPAIRAWKNHDPFVTETDVQIPDEGLFIVGARVNNLGDGYWHYEYAVQNLNSDRSGQSFSVPLPDGVIIPLESIGFHDVDYHSGEPYDGTVWTATVESGAIRWSTTPFDVDPNANALRWGTLYNFRFDANIGPDTTMVTLGLFKPGSPTDVAVSTVGPALEAIDCDGNAVADWCDMSCNALGCSPSCGGGFDCNDNAYSDDCDKVRLAECITGPSLVKEPAPDCSRFNFNRDNAVDLADVAVFQRSFSRTICPR